MDRYLGLAKKSIKSYLEEGKIIEVPRNLPPEMLAKRAGAFVSLHLKNGDLRGCIGTILPMRKNLAEEIIYNGIAAATEDPRFPPIDKSEFDELVFSVDVLSEPNPALLKELNPKKYGLIVSTVDDRRGLLLPDLPQIKTPEEQIAICRQKAGIGPDEPVSYQTFTVERHEEKLS